MQFGSLRNLQSGGIYEQDGVLYIGGQGYDLTTLALLPNKTLGSFDSQYVANKPSHPVLLPRYMTEARGMNVVFDDLAAISGNNVPTSSDGVFSGFGAAGSGLTMADGTVPVPLHNGIESIQIVKPGNDPSDAKISYEKLYSTAAVSIGSRHSSALVGSGAPLQVTGRFLNNNNNAQAMYFVIRTENPNPATVAVGYGATGSVFDVQQGNIGVITLDSAASYYFNAARYTVPGLVATTIGKSPVITGGNDRSLAANVVTPAILINGRRRAYAVQLKLTGSGTTLTSMCIDYTDLSALSASNLISNTVNLNGITVDKCTPQTSAHGYSIIGSDGALYIVAFISDFSAGGTGQVMVFKETAVGQLTLLSYIKDTVADAMRCSLCVKNDNKEWLVMTSKGFDTWRWNETTKRPERQSTIGGMSPAAIGRDSLGRIWVVERPVSDQAPGNMKVNVFPPEGIVSFIKFTWDTPDGVDYNGTNIPTNISVESLDRTSVRIAANVKVTLTGPATFADGTISKTVATNAQAPVSVPIVITGPGRVSAEGSL